MINNFNERVSWKGSVPITLYIHESVPQEFRDNIRQAAQVWNYKKQLLIVSDNIINGPINSITDKRNIIYYVTEYTIDDNPHQQAVTKTRWMGDKIIDADILINAHDFKFYPGTMGASFEVSMLSLLIHEIGHVLGLDHNNKDMEDVMYPYLANNLNRFQLTESDKQSIECEY